MRAGGERLEQLRQDRHTTEQRLDAVRTRTRTLDLEANEVDLRTEALHEHVGRDLGAQPDDLVGLPEPEAPEGTTLVQHAEELERKLVALGPVNPLALEELSALEERHKELEAQVDDVRGARRELHEVVRTLDDEIMTSFAAAAADVNEHFSALVAMLFPGGTGRLVLHGARRPPQHGRRDRGAPGRPQRAPRVAALGRRALHGRAGVPLRRLPQPAVALLPDGRGGGRARRRQPAAASSPSCTSSATRRSC